MTKVSFNQSGGTSWCGPVALSVVCGCSYEEAQDVFKKVVGRDVKGTFIHEMTKALTLCGFHFAECNHYSGTRVISQWNYHKQGISEYKYIIRPTFAQWWKRHDDLATRIDKPIFAYVLCIGGGAGMRYGHWVVVKDGKVFDRRYPNGTAADKPHAYRRNRVKRTFIVAVSGSVTSEQKET